VTGADIVARARTQIGLGTRYALGWGDHNGTSPDFDDRAGVEGIDKDPDDTDCRQAGACDCSAFVCWCLRMKKHQPDLGWLRRLNGGWFATDGIWWDAVKQRGDGLFRLIRGGEVPVIGAVVVFPSSRIAKLGAPNVWRPGDPEIGHVGVISQVEGGAAVRVIHCSSGNYKRVGDAIQETDLKAFARVGTTAMAVLIGMER
jgi:hypothetical protein